MNLFLWTNTPSTSFHYGRALLAGVLAFLSLGIVTAVVPNPLFTRMIPVYYWDYLFLGTTTLLAAYYFGRAPACRTSSDDGYALLGGLAGLFSFACPVCNGLLLALFSASTIMTYIEPLRPFLGIASTGILALFVYRGSTCEDE